VSNMNAPTSLLVNQTKSGNHWIAFRTVGTKSNRDGIGAKIRVKVADRVLVDEVRSGSSYDSNNDMRVHFGLGRNESVEWVEVRWPSGLAEKFTGWQVDGIRNLQEGSGAAINKAAQ
jgi:enediyne biosynthesis protein E4